MMNAVVNHTDAEEHSSRADTVKPIIWNIERVHFLVPNNDSS